MVSCIILPDKSSETAVEQTTLVTLLIDQLDSAMEEIPTGGMYVCIVV